MTSKQWRVAPGDPTHVFAPDIVKPINCYSRERAAAVVSAMNRPVHETSGEWRCFHCDEVFTDREKAAEHFGKYEMLEPACTIDVAEYRRMEEVNRQHCSEDTELHRAIHRMSADHQVALRREEETGYARGLRDAGFSEKTPAQGDTA